MWDSVLKHTVAILLCFSIAAIIDGIARILYCNAYFFLNYLSKSNSYKKFQDHDDSMVYGIKCLFIGLILILIIYYTYLLPNSLQCN